MNVFSMTSSTAPASPCGKLSLAASYCRVVQQVYLDPSAHVAALRTGTDRWESESSPARPAFFLSQCASCRGPQRERSEGECKHLCGDRALAQGAGRDWIVGPVCTGLPQHQRKCRSACYE